MPFEDIHQTEATIEAKTRHTYKLDEEGGPVRAKCLDLTPTHMRLQPSCPIASCEHKSVEKALSPHHMHTLRSRCRRIPPAHSLGEINAEA